MTDKPRLFGADYSVYVRIARLALSEKNVDYELVPVDIFAADGPPGWYRDYHPFGRIPAFEHGDLRLYETAAITRYVDEAFDGPTLQPPSSAARATMTQAISILDAYGYRPMVWGIYVERVSKGRRGETCDERLIAASVDKARTCLAALSGLKRSGRWLLGDQLTLADLHAAPMFACLFMAPEGKALIEERPDIAAWWDEIRSLPSLATTLPSG